ncbi:hypothetical protein K440DRAFT_546868 [Wilcoxina mikolae CBS 423.85]|nr:hypothetical protein K440DRAFT_546868 [Wilcoxina mikolae CBS 423.85]
MNSSFAEGQPYQVPSFPSLYWPIDPTASTSTHLYYTHDIWRFTLMWTIILFAGFHLASGICSFVVMPSKLSLGVPLTFAIYGCFQATMAGSVVGLILGAVYKAGYLNMSTWIPLVWSAINVLVIVLSSFSLQGGL